MTGPTLSALPAATRPNRCWRVFARPRSPTAPSPQRLSRTVPGTFASGRELGNLQEALSVTARCTVGVVFFRANEPRISLLTFTLSLVWTPFASLSSLDQGDFQLKTMS